MNTLAAEQRVELFADRLRDYQVGVHRCESATLSATIADTTALRKKGRLLVPREVPRDWLPPVLDVVEDAGLTYADLDRSELVGVVSIGDVVRAVLDERKFTITSLERYILTGG